MAWTAGFLWTWVTLAGIAIILLALGVITPAGTFATLLLTGAAGTTVAGSLGAATIGLLTGGLTEAAGTTGAAVVTGLILIAAIVFGAADIFWGTIEGVSEMGATLRLNYDTFNICEGHNYVTCAISYIQ